MRRLLSTGALLLCLPASHAGAIDIVVDYTYDTNGFFASQASQDAMQAVADRFSAIITSNLTAVGPGGTGTGTGDGWRVGFRHPGTGTSIEISTAANAGGDPLFQAFPTVGEAFDYGFAGLNQNEWVLFAGGRPLSSAGVGGTGGATNFSTVFTDTEGPYYRGAFPITAGPDPGIGDLPVWGGSISFDSSRDWDFSLDSAGGLGSDFYTIALHEVGHALGLAAGWNQWEATGSSYTGSEALAAYNADNGTSLTSLSLDTVAPASNHWQDGAYDSAIFAAGNPNYHGTVGAGNLQDLLMEPIANFTPSINRLELTNVDVAALRDLGWQTVAPDLNGDGFVGLEDLDILLAHWGDPAANPAAGDANGDGTVDSDDLDIVIDNWGIGTPPSNLIPEPGTLAVLGMGGLMLVRRRRSA